MLLHKRGELLWAVARPEGHLPDVVVLPHACHRPPGLQTQLHIIIYNPSLLAWVHPSDLSDIREEGIDKDVDPVQEPGYSPLRHLVIVLVLLPSSPWLLLRSRVVRESGETVWY